MNQTLFHRTSALIFESAINVNWSITTIAIHLHARGISRAYHRLATYVIYKKWTCTRYVKTQHATISCSVGQSVQRIVSWCFCNIKRYRGITSRTRDKSLKSQKNDGAATNGQIDEPLSGQRIWRSLEMHKQSRSSRGRVLSSYSRRKEMTDRRPILILRRIIRLN